MHSAYLGKPADLSLERLNAIAYELAGRANRLPSVKSHGGPAQCR
jgi:hypothetical protein